MSAAATKAKSRPGVSLPEFRIARGFKVVRRRAINEGTFPSEIVTCRNDAGAKLQIFCKSGAGHVEEVHGHKRGVAYEAEVYRRVLKSVPLPLPKLIKTYQREKTHHLLLEALMGCDRTHIAGDPDAAMLGAARWIGRFHSLCTASRAKRAFPNIILYDRDYYSGWARRTAQFSQPLHEKYPWLPNLCEQFTNLINELLSAPQCVIHGEYYPKNILWRDGTSFPVDWESAAIGPGEIDIASLTEGWPTPLERQCEQEYCAARWSGPTPDTFKRTLIIAKVYQTLRWLGDRPQWTTANHTRWLFKRLHSNAVQLGIVS